MDWSCRGRCWEDYPTILMHAFHVSPSELNAQMLCVPSQIERQNATRKISVLYNSRSFTLDTDISQFTQILSLDTGRVFTWPLCCERLWHEAVWQRHELHYGREWGDSDDLVTSYKPYLSHWTQSSLHITLTTVGSKITDSTKIGEYFQILGCYASLLT